jgi:hypothetical protein
MGPDLWRKCWKLAALELSKPGVAVWDCGGKLCMTNGPCAVYLAPWEHQVQTIVSPLPAWAAPVRALGESWPLFTFTAKPSKDFTARLRAELPCNHGPAVPAFCMTCEGDDTIFVLGHGFPPVGFQYARLLLSLLEACDAPRMVAWSVPLPQLGGEPQDRAAVFDLEGGPRILICGVRVLSSEGVTEVHCHAD